MVPVVFEDGSVEYLPSTTVVVWPIDGRVKAEHAIASFGERPRDTSGAPFRLADGRLGRLEGWKDEALRLREATAARAIDWSDGSDLVVRIEVRSESTTDVDGLIDEARRLAKRMGAKGEVGPTDAQFCAGAIRVEVVENPARTLVRHATENGREPRRGLVLTDEEVRAALAGELSEIRRPVEQQPELDPHAHGRDSWIWRSPRLAAGYCHTDREAMERLMVSTCPYGSPGDLLWGQEAWRSWRRTCAADYPDDEHSCGPHCNQTYVAYAITPRNGYRPVPDKAAITYLDETSPLELAPVLLGPWKPADTMPAWASRFSWSLAGTRCERGAGGAWEWVLVLGKADAQGGSR